MSEIVSNKVDEIQKMVLDLFRQKYPRNDYREFLDLVLVFLDATPDDYKFRKPGAVSHARFMAKAIYTLKIYIFRTEFKLKKSEENALRNVCLFIVIVYTYMYGLLHQTS